MIIDDFKAINDNCRKISRVALWPKHDFCPDCRTDIIKRSDGGAYCPWCNKVIDG